MAPRHQSVRETEDLSLDHETGQSSSTSLRASFDKNTISRTGGNSLCIRCQNLRLDEAVDHIPAKKAIFIASLAEREDIKEKQDCNLCDLIRAITNIQGTHGRAASTKDHDLYMLPGSSMWRPEYVRNLSSKELGVAFGVFRRMKTKELAMKDRVAAITKGFMAPINLDTKSCQAFQVQRVSQGQANFSTIRAWIRECENSHSDSCKPETKDRDDIPSFKCIDVETRKRVSIDSDAVYYALSYVWLEAHGKNESPRVYLADEHPLPQPGTPQLIEDAIAIVKQLRGKYLWVDEYCNAQNLPELLKKQLDTMDKVYEGARATIVVAPARTDPKKLLPGIPGVSRPRVQCQSTATVGNYVFAASLPHVSYAVEQSTWITRAWTYQEVVLSTRCLFFTDVQVYFTCSCMTVCESIAVSPAQWKIVREPQEVNNSALKRLSHNKIRHTAPLRYFFENLQQYKSRDLTNEEDSLNAFRGLLAKAPFMNIWGVPIVCSDQLSQSHDERTLSIGLARGLWWECPGGTVYDCLRSGETQDPWYRYADFPSWSWAGWRGKIRLHEDMTSRSSTIVECNQVDEEFFNLEFKVQYMSGNFVSLTDFTRRLLLSGADGKHPERSFGEDITLTHTLHVRTLVHLIAVRYGPDQNQRDVCICACPSHYQQCVGGHTFGSQRVRFFVDIFMARNILEFTFPNSWGALPLFRCRDSKTSSIACLIIDWKNEREYESEVRGVAYLQDEVFYDSHRKVIRLV